jgi:hypothetical protein
MNTHKSILIHVNHGKSIQIHLNHHKSALAIHQGFTHVFLRQAGVQLELAQAMEVRSSFNLVKSKKITQMIR